MNLDLLRKLNSYLPRHPLNQLSAIDDASYVPFENRGMLIKVDGYSLSRSLYPWCSARDWGFRAITTAVSDVYAKGCIPRIYAVSIGLPPSWGEQELREIVKGIAEAVRFYGGFVENVDTNYGEDGWIDVFVVAECRALPIPRFARHGAVLVVTKKLGAGGYSYLHYRYGEKIGDDNELCRDIITWGCRPVLNPWLPYALEKVRGLVLGSIDVSDTLYDALNQLSEPLGLEPFIYANPRDFLITEYLKLCQRLGLSAEECALMTCEDYALLLAVEPNAVEDVLQILEHIGEEPIAIGWLVGKGLGSFRGSPLLRISWSHREARVSLRDG